MRILYVAYQYYPVYSGYGLKINRLSRELKKTGFRPSVLSVRVRGGRRFEEVEGIPVFRLATFGFPSFPTPVHRLFFNLNLLFYLLFHLSSYDILHTTGNDLGIFLAVGLTRLSGKKTIHSLSMLGDDSPGAVRSSRLGGLRLLLLRQADKIICSSTALYDDCLKEGIPADRIVRIDNGVKIDIFRPAFKEKNRLRKKHSLAPDDPVLVFVGSVSRRKGFDLLLEVFRKLRLVRPQLKLIVIGPKTVREHPFLDKEFLQSIEDRVREEGLEDSLLFTGKIQKTSEMVEYLQLADIFVFPSRKEGSPNALLEAMACGLPVIAANLPGITDDIIGSGENGVTLPGEVSAFSEAISELLDDPERRKEMGEKARATIRDNYSFKFFVERHAAVYRKAIG